jgi:hypothetical protein
MNQIAGGLTREQKHRLAAVHQEWLSAGKNSERLDRCAAADIIAEYYFRIGRSTPRVLFFSSPAMCLLATAVLATKSTFWHRIQRKLTDQFACLWEQLLAQLESQVERTTIQEAGLRFSLESGLKSLITALRRQITTGADVAIQSQIAPVLYHQLNEFLSRNQTHSVWGEPWDHPIDGAAYYLHNRLLQQIEEQDNFLKGALSNSLSLDPWSVWETFYVFCGEVLGVRYSPDQSALLDLAFRSSRLLHFWSPYEGVAFCSEWSRAASVDEQGRLHGADLAVAYSDGWGAAAWHGIPLSVKYQSPDACTVLVEPNAELRRLLMERYDAAHGNGRFIQDASAKVIDSAIQPMCNGGPDMINELLSLDLPGDPDGRMVAAKVICPSTGRVYILRVPPDQTTVRGALAWTFGMKPEEYVFDQET